MGLTVNEVIATLPAQRQQRIERRYRELKMEIEGLNEPRKVAGKAPSDIAVARKRKQPSS